MTLETEITPKTFYGAFDIDGRPQGFWIDDIYPPQEDGARHAAVEITEAVWQELLASSLARYINDAVTYVEAPPPPPEEPNPTLQEAQRANTRLDAGVTAAEDTVRQAMADLRTLPATSSPPTVEELQAQIAYLAEQTRVLAQSHAAMIVAQTEAPP
jgi:hypothetical protein